MNASDFSRVRQLLKNVLAVSSVNEPLAREVAAAGLIRAGGLSGHFPNDITRDALRLMCASKQRYWLEVTGYSSDAVKALCALGLLESRYLDSSCFGVVRRVQAPPAELIALLPPIDPTWLTIPGEVTIAQVRRMVELKLVRLDACSGLQWARL